MPASKIISGWLFDIYASSGGMILWIIDQNGEKHRVHRPFTPSFFLHVHETDRRRAGHLSDRAPVRTTVTPATQMDIYSGDWLDVQRVNVHDPLQMKSVVRYFERFLPHFAFFNSDILPEQLFLYGTGLFPLARGEYAVDPTGELTGWRLQDSRDPVEY